VKERKASTLFLLVFFFYALSLSISIAQTRKGFSANTQLAQSSITQWTGENGLISNNITGATQSRSGFIWITTYNGIMRFDGKRVEVYDRTNIPFLSTDAFYGVQEDKEGTLWFASQGSGVVFYKGGKFGNIDPNNEILPKSIRCLLLQEDGTVWAGANGKGLYSIKDGKVQHINHPKLDDTGILDLVMDKENNLWIATDGHGLLKYRDNNFTEVDGLPSNIVNAIQVTEENELIIGTTNGLAILSAGKLRKYDQLQNFQINEIICDALNRIWVGSELGLGRILLKDNRFEFLGERQGYPLGRINGLFFDNENSLWISTGRNGLVQMKETSVVNFTESEGLSLNKVNVITEAANGKFYIGTDGGGVDMYENGNVTPLKIKTPLTDAGIRDILVDNDALWIASYRGVLKYSGSKEKLFGEKDGLPAIDARRILKDDEGNLWIATRSGGVIKFKNDHVVKVINKENGLSSNYVLALEQDAKGNIYVGTHSGGMTIIHRGGSVNTYHIEKDDAGVLIFNIHIDEEGRIWLVSNIGPLHFDGSRFIKININKAAKGETYFDWIEDRIGNVWITTNIGVLKILKSEVLQFVTGKTETVNTKLFDNQDGMKNKECTGATHSLLSSSGKIWVPTLGGIAVFYPEKTKENIIPPPVLVTHLLVDNDDMNVNQSLIIEPGKLRYTFNYTGLSFVSPGKVRFRYKLENVDEKWIEAGIIRQAEYTNLKPGDYEFKVTACNNDGVWNEQGASLGFTVKPFFYQTFQFYALSVILALTLFYGIYRWRVHAVEKRNAELRKVNSELDRFVYSASHDLRAPLASILGLINVARLDDADHVHEYLKKIEISVKKLDGFVRDIIDFSRNARVELEAEPIDFKTLINEVIDNLMYLDEKNEIKRIVNVVEKGVFYTDKKRLGIVLSNLVSNSIKYFNPRADGPFLEVTATCDEKQATIVVKDNGIGIGEEHMDHIFKMFYRGDAASRGSGLGLYIVKETLDKIKGGIKATSVYGKGSTFTVTLTSLKKMSSSKMSEATSKNQLKASS
jgi:signal transduction histidine kinase/ligand-binding sensor domain-containing protein